MKATPFSTTRPAPSEPGLPIDVKGPVVDFIRGCGDFQSPGIGERFQARQAAVEAVKQRMADVAGYVTGHSLLATGAGLDLGAQQLTPQLQREGFSDKDLDHLLAMTNMASSASASGFEGWSPLRASTWWSRVIGQIKSGNGLFSRGALPPPVTEALLSLVDTARATEDEKALLRSAYVQQQADRFMYGILALRPGQSYCLAGGWAGKPAGHAMVYRFERNRAGSFNVYVYNAWGPELEGGRRIEGMLNSRPCYVFENVTSEDLFFTSERPGLASPPPPNSAMIQRLLELKAEQPPGAKKRGIKDVLNCFCRLKPKLVPGNKFRNLFLRAQRAGNCAVKGVNCLLLDLLGDKTAYKKLILDERLFGLLVYRQAFCLQQRPPLPPFARRDGNGRLDVRTYLRQFALLRRAARNFLTILEKNYKNGVITPAELPAYEQAFATAKQIIDDLQTSEAALLKQRRDEGGLVREAIPSSMPDRILVAEQARREQGVAALAKVQAPAQPAVSQFTVDANLGLNAQPMSLPRVLATLKTTMTEASKAGYHQAAIAQFELTMGHLFLGIKALQGPDGQVQLAGLDGVVAAPAAQADLLECLQIYSKSVYGQNGTPSARVQNAGMAAMALSYVLGCWHEAGTPGENLSRFGVHIRHFEQLSRHDHSVFAPLDGVAVDLRNMLLDFWHGVNAGPRLGRQLFSFNHPRLDAKALIEDRVPELALYKGYQAAIGPAVAPDAHSIRGLDYFSQQRMSLFLTLKKDEFPAELAHLGALKQTAALAFGLFVPGIDKCPTNTPFTAWLVKENGDVNYCLETRQWRSGSPPIDYAQMEEADYPGAQRKRYNWGEGKYDTLPEGRFSKYTANPQHGHVQDQDQGLGAIQAENDLLMAADVAADRDMALCEPGVQTSLLFGVIGENLAELSKPEWRSYVEAECFKTIDVGGRTVSPLCEQLRDDAALITKLDHLTDHCMKQLVEATPRDPKLKEMLFIIRLRANVLANKTRLDPAYLLTRQPPGLNSVEINERIFNWLRNYDAVLARALLDPGLLTEARDEILQKRREIALAHAGLLLSLPAADLDLADPATRQLDGQLQQRYDLFNLMLMVNKDFQAFSKVESRSFLRECQYRFSARPDLWRIPPAHLEALANRITGNLDAGFAGRPGWRLVGGRLELAAMPGQDGYVVDLTRPMVFKNGQELSQATFAVTEEFRRLFESRQFEVRREGPDTISFDDERWGKIHIRGRGADCQIWRWYALPGQQPKWYLYRRGNPDDLKRQLQINDALCFDYVHWLDVDTREVLIFDLHPRAGDGPRYQIKHGTDPAGLPLPLSQLVDFHNKQQQLCLLPDDFSAAAARLEDMGQVTAWSSVGVPPGQTVLSYLEFPRFRMQDSCLRFDWDQADQSWVYGADRRFKISAEPSVPLLDGLSRYLHLVQEEPTGGPGSPRRVVKRKVLIPSGQVRSKGFEEHAEIGLPDAAKDDSRLSLKYFEYEYDEEKGELIPDSLEARVYLAHLYLAQKRYQEAREVLKKISMSANPSPEAVKLLQDMLKSGEELQDLSPNACAIRLYAYLIFKKIKPRERMVEAREGGGERVHYETIDYEKIGEEKNKHQSMTDVYKTYIFAPRAVEAPLVFDAETELEILQLLRAGDRFSWRRTDLLREIAQHIQAQLPPGAHLTSDQQANLQAVSPEETWELDRVVLPSAWPDLSRFVPKWPHLCSQADAVAGTARLPYSDNYALFASEYQKIRRATPLEREGIAYDLISSKRLGGFTKEQQEFLIFVAGHPELLPLPPMPDDYDAAGRWGFFNRIFNNPAYQGRQDAVPTLEADLPEARELVPQARQLDPLLAPSLLLAAPPAEKEVPLVFAGIETELAGWQDRLLDVPVGRVATPSRPRTPPPGGLTPRERPFGLGAGRELDRYVADQDSARVNEAMRPKLRVGVDPFASIADFEAARDHDRQWAEGLKEGLLALANRPSPVGLRPDEVIAAQVARAGRVQPDLDLNTILRAAATSSAALSKLNQFLTPPEVETLRSLCLDYMVVKTHGDHVERILKPLTSWRAAWAAGRPIDPQWQLDFVDALAQPRTYNPYDARAQDYFPLLFEYMSGMRVWGNQASIIRVVLSAVVESPRLEEQNKIFQRIMAGGKTSVIISALLEIISQSGQLPVVLCHHSQYASVSGNLHNFQESRYDRDVYAIDYDIKQLGDPAIVQEVLAKILEADRKGCSLLMKSSMPQVIELKFIMEVLRLPEIREQRGKYERELRELEAALPTAPPAVRPGLEEKRGKLLADIDECDERLQKIMPNINLLAQVIRIFKARGVGVLDECDIILSMLMEVNVPRGDEEMLTPERADLVREIYTVLVSDEPLPGAPLVQPLGAPLGTPPMSMSIRQFIGLERNDQAKLSETDFNTLIAPFLAGKLLDNYYNEFRLKGMWGDLPDPDPGLRASFVRYIAGRISVADQERVDAWVEHEKATLGPDEELEERVKRLPSTTEQECDLKFLCSLAALKRHSNKYKRAAADKIALSGRIIRDVLQLALSRSCDRAYGRDPAHDNGSVIPFLGVNAPATTRFGYVYLALCYQFQAALNKDISVGELRFLAKKMGDAAQDYARKARAGRATAFEDQPEAVWFFEVTGGAAGGGIRLSDAMKDEAALRQACARINADPRRKLKVEAEIAPFHVRYYKERVSSNPINFAEQLRKLFGCSGTPWNWHSYHRKFGELEADRGVEGKILNAMTERASRTYQPYAAPSPYPPARTMPGQPPQPPNIYQAITTLRDDGLQPILDHLRHHPQRNRVRALIDAGGFLKGTNNATAAEAILHLHRDPAFCVGQPPAIDAVIYLHQFSAAEVAAGKPREKFMILKWQPDGSFRREELPDTSAATIANCGIPKERIFVLFDELRATGTDIPMADDTICLQTVDARMPVRTLLQAALRARRYFQGQDCEFLVTARGREEMLNHGATVPDIINTLIKNQAVADGDQTFRRYMAHITNSARVAVVNEMLREGLAPEAVAENAQRYRSFLVSSFEDDPYRQFARVEGPRPTGEILLRHATETLVSFYKKRLNLDTLVPPGPEAQRRPSLEAIDRALRDYVARVLDLSRPPVDRDRDLLPRAQQVRTPPGPTAEQSVYLQLCKIGWASEVEGSIRSILTDAQKDLREHVLPPELLYRAGADVDAQVEVEREIDMELGVEEEQEQEVRQELVQQLEEMNLIRGFEKYTERAWSVVPDIPRGARLGLQSLMVENPPRSGLMVRGGYRSVSDVCNIAYPPPVGRQLAQYAGCFPPNLRMTDNLRHTYEGCDLPLLHKKMKNANFMLVVETRPGQPPECLLLSKKDAVYFKSWIKRCQPSNAWLVDMNGLEEITNPTRPVPLADPNLQIALWHANLFNGNVQYLEDHRDLTLRIFDGVGRATKQKMCDFAILRANFNPHRRKTALTSELIVPSAAIRQRKQGVIFGPRRNKLQEMYENVKLWDADAEWETLSPAKVRELEDGQLQYLVSKEQVAAVPLERLKFLQPEQADLLSPAQLAALNFDNPEIIPLFQGLTDGAKLSQVRDHRLVSRAKDEQVPLLASELLPWLGNEQIKHLKLADASRWPPDVPNFEMLAMVQDEQALPVAWSHRFHQTANGLAVPIADIAGWLIPDLDHAHMPLLARAGRLDEISTAQAKVLDPQLVQYLRRRELVRELKRPDQIQQVHGDAVQHLDASQVVSINPPTQAQHLTPDQVALLRQPAFVPYITHDAPHVAQVSADLIPYLADQDVNLLPADRLKVNNLNARQVNLLNRPELIQLLDDAHVKMLTSPAVVMQLLADQVNMLTIGQLQLLHPGQIDLLTEPTLIAALTPTQVDGHFRTPVRLQYRQHIRNPDCLLALNSDEQLSGPQKASVASRIMALPVGSLKDLRTWCSTEAYAWPRFRRLARNEYLALYPSQLQFVRTTVEALTPDRLALIAGAADPGAPDYLSDHYLEFLTPPQLSQLDDRHKALVGRLNQSTLQQLQGRQVDLVPANRLSELAPGQYQHIMDPGLLRAAVLSRLIRRDLRQEQLRRVRDVGSLLQLENVDIKLLAPEQVQMLTGHLNQMDFPALQVLLITRPWAIDLAVWRVLGLQETEFQSLQATRVGRQITDKLTALINGQQIPQIKEWLQRSQLAPHYLDLLSQAQLDVADSVVVDMLRPWQIQRLKAPQVKMLTAVAVQHVTVDQLLLIDLTTQAAGISPAQLHQFDARHQQIIPRLSRDQLRELQGQAALNLVPADRLGDLRPEQYAGITDRGLLNAAAAAGLVRGGLRREQLQLLALDALLQLDNVDAGLSPAQITLLKQHFAGIDFGVLRGLLDQHPWMRELAMDRLLQSSVEELTALWEVASGQQIVDQITAKINVQPVATIADWLARGVMLAPCLGYLSREQLGALNPGNPQEVALANLLPPDQVRLLGPDQVRMLEDPAQINRIRPDQVPMLADDQIQHLREGALVDAVPENKLQLVHIDMAERCWPRFSVLDADRFARLSAAQQRWISETKIPSLTGANLAGLSAAGQLHEHYLQFMTNPQLLALTPAEGPLVGRLPADRLQVVTNVAVLRTVPRRIQAERLSDEQITQLYPRSRAMQVLAGIGSIFAVLGLSLLTFVTLFVLLAIPGYRTWWTLAGAGVGQLGNYVATRRTYLRVS